MTAELRRSIFLACVGLLGGFALVVTLYGANELFKHGFGAAEDRAALATIAPGPAAGEGTGAMPGKPLADAPPDQAQVNPAPMASEPAASSPKAGAQASAPTFDIIRVEPSGEAVIAGRATPNTTVELLRDGEPVARALVDPSGQFAIVPPALAPGSSEITLRATGPDGRPLPSRESVAVVVSPRRDAKPLVALTSPDKPTVVLSQPDPKNDLPQVTAKVEEKAKSEARAEPPRAVAAATATPAQPTEAGKGSGNKNSGEKAPEGKPVAIEKEKAPGTVPVKIVSVEAEEGGRLYVTGQAQPGATVRLYLNDTAVAPGSVGADGRFAFTIGRGVQPGAYAIRVDEVDPVSGRVKTRSEVPFAVPAPKIALGKPEPAKPEPAKPAAKVALLAPRAPEVPAPKLEIQKPSQILAASPPPPPTGTALPARAMPAAEPKLESNPESSPKPGPEREAKAEPKPDAKADPAPRSDGPPAVFVPEIGTAKIVRGDSLWQISRRIYGRGTRYTVIYDANQPQIRNPDRIYPGQIFVLPNDGTTTAAAEEKRS